MKKYILIIISVILVIFIFNIVSAFNFKQVSNINNDINKNNGKTINNILDVLNNLQSLPNGSIDKVQKETLSEHEYAKEVGTEIIRCLKRKDRQGLNDLFCDKVRGSDYLMNEIDIVFDYIDKNGGLFIEDGKWNVPTSHGSNGYNGKVIQYLSCDYTGSIKIDNIEYTLCFTAYQLMKGHPEYQGILTISFSEKVSQEIINKAAEIKKNGDKQLKYLGMKLYNRNYDTYQQDIIFSKEFYENELYVIPDDLEKGRSKW